MKHLEEQGFTYWQHFKRACKFSFVFYIASLRLVAHAVYPDLFKKDTTTWINEKLRDYAR